MHYKISGSYEGVETQPELKPQLKGQVGWLAGSLGVARLGAEPVGPAGAPPAALVGFSPPQGTKLTLEVSPQATPAVMEYCRHFF